MVTSGNRVETSREGNSNVARASHATHCGLSVSLQLASGTSVSGLKMKAIPGWSSRSSASQSAARASS